jgi:hypothetical protein
MSDCCSTADGGNSGVCPACGAKARPVATLTVKSLVRDHGRVPAVAAFSFCRTPDCEIVYFSGTIVFLTSDVKVRVGIKEYEDPSPVCYCFDYTRADIHREIEQFGKSRIPEKIKAEVQAGFCACEVKNPSAKCCLGNVRQMIQERMAAIHDGIAPGRSDHHEALSKEAAGATCEPHNTGMSSDSSMWEMAGARKVWNWTRSLVKSKSSVQSNATRSFFSNRGSLLR